jgi:hypothetical protein
MYPEELIGVEIYKVFNESKLHRGFQIQEDFVNKLIEPFDKTGYSVSSGFFFTTKEHVKEFLHCGECVRRVYVPFDHPDVEVVLDPSGIAHRTNMLMLGERCTVEELFSIVPTRNLLEWGHSTNQPAILAYWKDHGTPGIPEISIEDASKWGADRSPRVVEEQSGTRSTSYGST